MSGGILFNSNSLQTPSIITSEIDHHSSPRKSLSMAAVAYGNKSIITNYNYTGKEVIIRGQIKDVNGNIANMDAIEDQFKGILVGSNGELDIEHGTGYRRYLATPEIVQVGRDGGLAFGDFEVTFICSRPFAIDLLPTQLDTTTGYSSATRIIPMAMVGNAEYQYPIVAVTLVSGTQLASQSISIGNNANGQVLTVTRTWVAGDVLTIDSYNSLVMVNNVEVFFTGAIPIFKAGAQNMTYSDTFLTRNVNFDVSQYGYWL